MQGQGEEGLGQRHKAVIIIRKLGCTDFCLLERQSGIGGTWWINTYPGIACDILWEVTTRQLLPGLGDLSAAERKRILETEGPSSVFLNETTWTCRLLVSAVGGLVEPAPWPANVAGKDKFQGKVIHSARWDSNTDFRGKNIVVVGTGCSATQLVLRILDSDYGASHVTQLIREPLWVLPRVEPPLGDHFYEKWSLLLCLYIPTYMRAFRAVVILKLLQHIRKTVPSKYYNILTLKYSIECKRRIDDTVWFPYLHNSRIELITLAIESIDENRITLHPGLKTHPTEKSLKARRVPADIIMLSNGLPKGTTLEGEFDERGGSQLYRSTALNGFPNLFILFGPNSFTGHSSVVLGLGNQIDHAIRLMRSILAGEAKTTEVKRSAVVNYNKENNSSCFNRYVASKGCNSMSYPYSMAYQTICFMFPTWSDWEVSWTRKRQSSAKGLPY
ncbi:hypothetical protein EDB80DRAFT_818229 [Ilyonectria destructans]|nr:hypothetical protein EDB80DRAFT_818229 [Ilyonectria destructans]